MDSLFNTLQDVTLFKNRVAKTNYEGNPVSYKKNKSGGKSHQLTKRYIKYVKEKDKAPLPPGIMYNPATDRIVKTSSVIKPQRGGVRKKYSDILQEHRGRVQSSGRLREQAMGKLDNYRYKRYKTRMRNTIRGLNQDEQVVINMNKLMDKIEDILDMVDLTKDYVLSINGQRYYTLNANSIAKLRETLQVWTGEYGQDSAEGLLYMAKDFNDVTIELRKPSKKTNGGSFFSWFHNTPMDLSRYQIYPGFNKENNKYNCFMHSLKQTDIDLSILVKCETMIFGKVTLDKKIDIICKKLNINIIITRFDGKRNQTYSHGIKGNPEYKIAEVGGHFFINEQTQYTKYYVKTCLSDSKVKPNQLSCGSLKNNRGCNSLWLVTYMLENVDTYLTPIPDNQLLKIICTDNFNHVEYLTLEPTDGDFKLIKPKAIKDITYTNVFFDFESCPYDIHQSWCCVCLIDSGIYTPRAFLGINTCGKNFLQFVYDEFKKNPDLGTPRFIAHNLKYDYQFIQEIEGVSNTVTSVEKDGTLYQVCGWYYGMKMEFHCSLLKMGGVIPLSGFKKNFGIEQEKDICPYGVYTEENVGNQYVPLDECLRHLRPSQHEQFKNNCMERGFIEDGMVDINNYGLHYCVQDVVVLKEGYNKYRDMVLTVNKDIDINNFLTLASIAHQHFILHGCYEDVYQLSGVTQSFIQNCVVGGKVMLHNNRAQNPPDAPSTVYDACSLYASAILEMGGYLKGTPKEIPLGWTYEDLRHVDGFFVLVKILKVNRHRPMPLLSYISESGSRIWTNNMEGKTIYLTKFGLEDAYKFHNIEYEIIQGLYFNEGRCTESPQVIRDLFDTRKIKKAEDNPIQLIYKLYMNSAYGKTIIKNTHTTSKYTSIDRFDDYLTKNFDVIKQAFVNKARSRVRIEEWVDVGEHYNSCHVGAEILAYSKRIMNRVVCLAEDLGIHIHYTDTDSIHLELNAVSLLEEKYFELYGKELGGKDLGQFHCDLESKIISDRAKQLGVKVDLISMQRIFLNKKDYCENVLGVLPNGEYLTDENGKVLIDYGIANKGIPELAIWYKCNQDGVNPIELYRERLLIWEEGNEAIFQRMDFNCLKQYHREENETWHKCSFEFNKNHTISNRHELIRSIGCC